MTCSNCEKAITNDALTISVSRAGAHLAFICDACQKNVTVMKIVLSRDSGLQELKFTQYLPVAVDRTAAA